ncbi:DUF2007 domain-containing protein [Sabulilitoribacter arenilitoris]|uniref:DUF2007 domain-containing protein n=1 Tax=Wocania arenilitoris TaxID=2044858 RepID=A0AAE3EKV5_9FLAO|nr:DUF2007 domain-containing protein [Wocania arenilitoris]MCF7566883.1 DUF2007 domain-containing protein [Wocania arenilitoris]
MIDNYTILATFPYSTEAQVTKAKLEAENIRVMLLDEKTVDSDPLISQAIGGVKLLVHNDNVKEAIKIYHQIRAYEKDKNGNDIVCVNCESTKILIAEPSRKNIFYMLFPFFEKPKYRCNVCNTIF